MPQLIATVFALWLIYKIVMFIVELVMEVGPIVLNIVAGLITCLIVLGGVVGACFVIVNYIKSFNDVMSKRYHGGRVDGASTGK